MPQILASTADAIKNFAVIYLVDIGEVPDFNTMYELYDPCTCMFFFRNKARPFRRPPSTSRLSTLAMKNGAFLAGKLPPWRSLAPWPRWPVLAGDIKKAPGIRISDPAAYVLDA